MSAPLTMQDLMRAGREMGKWMALPQNQRQQAIMEDGIEWKSRNAGALKRLAAAMKDAPYQPAPSPNREWD